MKKKYLIAIGILAIGLFALPEVIKAEQYGDVTCTEKFNNYFVCRLADGTLDHVFLSYAAMNAHYVPPDTEVFVPEVTYIYGAPTQGMQAQP